MRSGLKVDLRWMWIEHGGRITRMMDGKWRESGRGVMRREGWKWGEANGRARLEKVGSPG